MDYKNKESAYMTINTKKVVEDMANLAPESLEPTLQKPFIKKKKSSGSAWLVIVLVLVIIIAGVLFFLDSSEKISLFGSDKKSETPIMISGDWQAVFLTNGQVYFGQLSNLNSAYPELTNIYYLQVQEVPIQPAEPAETNEAGVQPAQQTTQRMILVKFGTEIHKPQDKMFINKEHIMFYETLQPDSQVLKAINDYLAGLPVE